MKFVFFGRGEFDNKPLWCSFKCLGGLEMGSLLIDSYPYESF